MSVTANSRCPCGSGLKYKRCCRPLHDGVPAQDAERLMRSRYAAFACARPDYLITTTHPANPQFQQDTVAWAGDLAAYSVATDFRGLRIESHQPGHQTSYVTFAAQLAQGGVDLSFRERSRFELVEGRWLYRAGTRL